MSTKPASGLDRLRRDVEAKVDALQHQLDETESHLLERRALVEPAEAPVLPRLTTVRAQRRRTPKD